MSIQSHFAGVSKQLQIASEDVKNLFQAHRATVGTGREELIAKFFQDHLPKAFGVGAGLIMSPKGEFSNQADIVIFDGITNAPLQAGSSASLFAIESVYCLIEAKTNLTPSELADAIAKCRRYKTMERRFAEFATPANGASLFLIFAFEAASPEKFKETLASAIAGIPHEQQPDFVVVPGSFVAIAGQYHEFSQLGVPGSSYRESVVRKGELDRRRGAGYKIYSFGENALLIFFIWLTSWLQRSGRRGSELVSYLPSDAVWGKEL